MESRIDEVVERCQCREFSLLAGALIGGAAHVGTNAFVKRMAKPGTIAQRVGSAIFQKGVRDKAAKRVIHPAVQKVSDALLGPEIGHLYHSGLKSNRITRKAIALAPASMSSGFGGSVKGVVAGKRSPLAERILNKLPSAPAARGVKKIDRAAGAAAAVAAGLVDPVLPTVNVVRSKLANSKLGKRVMAKFARRGADGKGSVGFGRALRDHLVSPSLGFAEDAGKFSKAAAGKLKEEAMRRVGEAGKR